MAFQLAQYIIDAGVEYHESRSKGRNNVYVKCPFCGDADPGRHMGINVETGYWGCWRDPRHRGLKPNRLLRHLLGLTWEQIERLVDSDTRGPTVSLDDLSSALSQIGHQAAARPVEEIKFDPEIRSLADDARNNDPAAVRMLKHLTLRGFDDPIGVAHYFNIHYAITGRFAFRLILPIDYAGRLIGWTARAVGPAKLRYLSYPPGDAIKRNLYGYDDCAEGGDGLVIVEGPFDRLKVQWYLHHEHIRSCAIMGTSVTEAQIALLLRLTDRFEFTWILQDDDALDLSLTLQSKLSSANPKVIQLPRHRHDPGEMTGQELLDLYKQHRSMEYARAR